MELDILMVIAEVAVALSGFPPLWQISPATGPQPRVSSLPIY